MTEEVAAAVAKAKTKKSKKTSSATEKEPKDTKEKKDKANKKDKKVLESPTTTPAPASPKQVHEPTPETEDHVEKKPKKSKKATSHESASGEPSPKHKKSSKKDKERIPTPAAELVLVDEATPMVPAVEEAKEPTESFTDKKKAKDKKSSKKSSKDSKKKEEERVEPVMEAVPAAVESESLVVSTPYPPYPAPYPHAENAVSQTFTPIDESDNVPLAKLMTPPHSPSIADSARASPTTSSAEKGKKKKRVFIMEQGSDDEDSEESEIIVVRKVVKKKSSKYTTKKGRSRVASSSESDSSDMSSDNSSDFNSSNDVPEKQPEQPKPSIFSSYLRRVTEPIGGGLPIPYSIPTNISAPKHSDSDDDETSSDDQSDNQTTQQQPSAVKSIFGTITSAFTSILEPELTPEEKARAKQRKAQDEAIKRQMENNAKFAALSQIPGFSMTPVIEPTATSLRPAGAHVARSVPRTPGLPIAPAPDSEREFSVGLNFYNQLNYQYAATHWERAIKIDDNAEALRMLIELYQPTRVPNAGKVAEYTARRKAVLATGQGMLNHGRHLARIVGTLDGPGIVLVRSAADSGCTEAMYEFGMYLRGKGKGAEAMSWLHRAADAGFVEAEDPVAEGYEKGIGVPVDTVAGAAWRARVVARLKVLEREQLAASEAAAELAIQLRKESKKRDKERKKMEQTIKQREENLLKKRAEDPALNSALRNLEWGFYASAVEQLANLATTGNVDAKEFLDPDLSTISPKAITAMFHIGQYHSTQADPATAVKWFRRSAESGYHEAQVTYAAYLIVGKGLDCSDPGQAMAWLMKAWEGGNNKEAALALGEAFTKGIGVAPDPTKAVKWYTRAWEAGGYSEAAFAVGLACATGFTPGAVDPYNWTASISSGRKDVNEVLDKRSKPVAKDESSGSESVPPKPVKSDLIDADAEISRSSTAPSHQDSKNSNPPDSPVKVTDSNSQLQPPPPTNKINSPLLKNFSAFKQDVVQAAMWYKKASDLGHSRACNNLGELYMTGRGIVRNDITGFGLFRRAAMAGLPEAEYNMGRCWREGRGCAKNEEQAVMWFKRAEAQGIKEATKALAGTK
ncbi:UNVERIFIED_CONTAM: hypothetical protein HDU68_012587 [Siphonaria sp. JEL0065]|nr:hypothetical protein HDU68_012587 [Siphonaria sp. JEL0065]